MYSSLELVKEYEYFLLLKVAKSEMEFWISSYFHEKLANNFGVQVHYIFRLDDIENTIWDLPIFTTKKLLQNTIYIM